MSGNILANHNCIKNDSTGFSHYSFTRKNLLSADKNIGNLSKMKKLIAITLCTLILSGCATKKELTPIGGSKSDGTIKMAYEYSWIESPTVDFNAAKALAAKKCIMWGYEGAESFGGQTSTCLKKREGGGCDLTKVTVEYQCFGEKPNR